MAKQDQSRAGELFGQAIAGAFVGVVVALAAKAPGEVGLVLGAVLPLLWDLRKRPWKWCPRCGGKNLARAGRTYGVKPRCWRCHDQKYPRIWVRPVIGLGWRPRGHPDRP